MRRNHGYIDPAWARGPRVILSTLRVGDLFLAADGVVYRVTGWYKDRVGECPYVVDVATGRKTLFAGCAEGVPASGVEP
jgi:hypothetical protein